MTNRKQKLELSWIGKDKRPRLESRILLEDSSKSYHAQQRVSAEDLFDNKLIFGDNLLALKALEQQFSGKVQCIYIDPPFNTQQALEYYEDGVEHSLWLSLLRDRLEVLYALLADEGSIFVHIDDNELGYLMVLMDEIFGRANKVSLITFKQSSTSGPKAINPGLVTTSNYILWYCKDRQKWASNKGFKATTRDDRYSKFIENFEDDFSKWRLIPLKEAFDRSKKVDKTALSKLLDAYVKTGDIDMAALKKLSPDQSEKAIEKFVLANAGRVVRTATVEPKDVNESAREALSNSISTKNHVFKSSREGKDDYFFLNGEQLIFYRSKSRVVDGAPVTVEALSNLWDDLLSNNLHKEGAVNFPKSKKPEALIKRILELSTKPGDLVLDSFAGSGTTGAVAHKMGRKWIMVELRDHCHTHVYPRMKDVIDGSDSSGITKAVDWKGGGGFRFFNLAPSLLSKDKWGNWIVSKEYNGAMLAEAMCKQMGFVYAPSDIYSFIHGYSSERDFIYVTTASLTYEQLKTLSDEVGEDRSLLICCGAFKADVDSFSNITVVKIPQAVLEKCEWGKDDYSFGISNLEPDEDDIGDLEPMQLSLLGQR